MIEKKVSSSSLSEEIYKNEFSYKKIIFFAFFAVTLGFVLNFPMGKNIDALIVKGLSSSKSCPVSFSESSFSFLWLPHETIKDLTIAAPCFKGTESLNFKKAELTFIGPSIFPPGIKFSAALDGEEDRLRPMLSLSPMGHAIKIEKSKLSTSTLTSLIGGKVELSGDLFIEALINTDLKFSNLQDGDFFIYSKNLKIPSQKIQIFNVPNLNLEEFELKSTLEGNNLNIINITLGKKEAPIHGKLKGKIILNKKNVQASVLNLEGDIKFSQSFLKSFAVLNLLLKGKKSKDGYYRINIAGSLSSPKPSIL